MMMMVLMTLGLGTLHMTGNAPWQNTGNDLLDQSAEEQPMLDHFGANHVEL